MRVSDLVKAALFVGAFGFSTAYAQVKSPVKELTLPRYDFSLGYNNIRANAPPGGCECFETNGGYASFGVHLTNWFSVDGEFTGNRASTVSVLGQDLTLLTYTVGPKVSYRYHRLTPYAKFLVGGAHGSDSYFPNGTTNSTSASSFAFSTGGGLDVRLTPHFSIRAADVQFLKTQFPNDADNAQNQLMIGAGVTVRFNSFSRKPHSARPVATPPPPPAPTVAFTCGTNVANVPMGQMVQVFGAARTEPEKLEVAYAWSADGATIEGTGSTVSINTTGMAVGDYRVKGHASLLSNTSSTADCETVFRVVAVEPPSPPTTNYVMVPDPAAKDDKLFHENVKDAFFDVNSAAIRPDTQASIDHAAQFLIAHPTIHVLVSGWADPRGSVEFNLALGIKRANAVRSALIAANVPAGQLEVLSNGKSSQVCTLASKNCYQQNRRVSFTMKP